MLISANTSAPPGFYCVSAHQTWHRVSFVLLHSSTRGPAQLLLRPMLDSPNNSPLLRHASKALIDSRKPAKVTRPPSPALATAAGMNLSHKPSVSRRESSATTWFRRPSRRKKQEGGGYGHRYTREKRNRPESSREGIFGTTLGNRLPASDDLNNKSP